MRRNPLVTFVSRCFIPSMSPVQGIHLTTSRPTRSTSTTRFASSLRSQVHNDTTKPTETTDEPPVLLLEGDNFQVSHDGVARTFYRLANRPLSTSSSGLGIEEYYDLKGAHKTFVLREGDDPSVGDVDQVLLGRQAQGLAPMGRALGHVEIQEIDEGVFGSAGTGATTWESSLVMGLFFADYPDLLRGALLEIGSGVGVGAILSHMGPLVKHHGPALRSVTLTDGNDECLRQCRQNIHQAWNELASLFPDKKNPPDIQVCKMDWNEDSGGDAIAQEYDTIIACDVCYLYPDIAPLVSTIRKLLGKDGKCHLFGPYNRGAFQSLCQQLHDENMDVHIESLDLERYRLKPADSARHRHSSSMDFVRPGERVYASKSQATILHVTVCHKNEVQDAANSQEHGNMYDLD